MITEEMIIELFKYFIVGLTILLFYKIGYLMGFINCSNIHNGSKKE